MRAFVLVAGFLLAAAASLPMTEVPVIDDWVYAYSVERFLHTGRLHVLDFSCRFNLAHVAWGALFGAAGFSFTALRISTLALAVLGLTAFHALVRRRTGDPSLAFWATAVLAFGPVFFRLSLSFMTDVPLVAIVVVCVWLFDVGLDGRRPVVLLAALALGAAAYLVRELAIFLPPALVAGAIWAVPERLRWRTVGALGAAAAVMLGAVLWWVAQQGSTLALDSRLEGLRYVLEVPLRLYASATLQMLLVAAFFVAPLALATVRDRRDLWASLGVGLGVALLGWWVEAIPFGTDDVLSPHGLGMSRALLPGRPEWASAGEVARGLAYAVACVSLSLTIGEGLRLSRQAWRRAAGAAGAHPVDVAWIAFGLAQGAALLVLWLWQDRYDLVLVPTALWIVARRAQRVGWSASVAAAGCALFAALSIAGTRDDFRLNRAVWQAESWLRTAGVAAGDIDAGYASNGWRLYAFADSFAPDFPAGDVPFVFSRARLPYVVSTTALPETTVVREWTWPRTWLSEPRVYALRR